MFPILIGSRALFEYGICESFDDIDLLVNNELGGTLSLNSDKKQGKMIWFGETKVDLHLLTEPSNIMLFLECNHTINSEKSSFVCKKIFLDKIGDVLLPPLELLYVLLKAHLHRIIPVCSYQDQNIDIWYKHVAFYKTIRDNLGYTKLDNILYKEYLGAWADITNDGSLEDLMKKIYQMRFKETIKRVGDTLISMEKSEEEFFADNVERFIDHDELHTEVGIAFREDPDPLFKKYQSDPTKVNLDREVFLKATPTDRIDMLREEVVVLLLERKWIPEIIKCYKEMCIPYIYYNEEEKANELKEVGANYVTNLCGQGDYWLRRFCIDHVHLLLDPKKYDFDKLKELTLKVTKYESKCEEIKETDLVNRIEQYKNENEKYIEFYLGLIKKYKSNLSGEHTKIFYSFSDYSNGDQVETIQYLDPTTIRWYHDNVKMDQISFGSETDKTILSFMKYFTSPYNLGLNVSIDEFIIYNLVLNAGLYYSEELGSIKIFTLSMEEKINDDNQKTLQISGSYIDIFGSEANHFNDHYIRKCKTIYYHSDSCTEQPANEGKIKFLSSYGTAPTFMKPLMEQLARRFLKLPVSEPENYWYKEYDSSDSNPEAEYTD